MIASNKKVDPKDLKLRRYLIARHGETTYNKERRVQGTSDASMLTLNGISQASSLGVYIARRQAGELLESDGSSTTSQTTIQKSHTAEESYTPSIKRTWCSPLTRCRQTYAAISGCCSTYSAKNSVLPEPTIHDDLREIELCTWQNRLRSDIIKNDTTNWNIFKDAPKLLQLPKEGKEFYPVVDCWERSIQNWNTIRSDAADAATTTTNTNEQGEGAIFIMCHGAIGQCMLLQALGIGIDHYGKSRRYSFDNCECIEIEWKDDVVDDENESGYAVRWRRVHPVTTEWELTSLSRKMGGELMCSR